LESLREEVLRLFEIWEIWLPEAHERRILFFDGAEAMKMWIGPIAQLKSPEARFQLSSFRCACITFTKYGDDCFDSFIEAFVLIVHDMSGWASLIEEEEKQH
jgi:hypothetical protein